MRTRPLQVALCCALSWTLSSPTAIAAPATDQAEATGTTSAENDAATAWRQQPKRNKLSFHTGAAGHQVRDQLVSPLRSGGLGWRLGLGLYGHSPRAIDRLAASRASGDLDGLAWTRFDIDYTYHHRVLERPSGMLYVGGAARGIIDTRQGNTESYNARVTLDPGVTWRMELVDREDVLLLDISASTPLAGLLLRPGFGSAFPEAEFDPTAGAFATPANMHGGEIEVGLTWLRARGSDARLAVSYGFERITHPHVVTSATLGLDVIWFWGIK